MVTGAGRGCCAGADIEAVFGAGLSDTTDGVAPRRTGDWVSLVRSTKPLVAAVNGVAVGVGLRMILPFDRIIASDRARFSLRFVKMGLVPELASSSFVPQRVGFGAPAGLRSGCRRAGCVRAGRALSAYGTRSPRSSHRLPQ